MTGEEDDRHRCARIDEFSLKVEAAQPREAPVEHEATRSLWSKGPEEGLSGRKHVDGQPDRGDESPEGLADG